MEVDKFDFDGTLIELNDIVVFFQSGLVGKGRVVALEIPDTFGCVIVQSLREKSRTQLTVAKQCAVVQKAVAGQTVNA